MKSIRFQSILFHNDPVSIRRAFSGIVQTVAVAKRNGLVDRAQIVYGDCSAAPIFSAEALAELRATGLGAVDLDYRYFGKNLGSALGHNTLASDLETDFVVIANPDVVFAPDTLSQLFQPFSHDAVGMVEARQLPIEHPKAYDAKTGDTSWATTAAALIPSAIMKTLQGFDADSFFLYCDDVDFSWRVRLLGHRVIYQPSAVIFHDKRLSKNGGWLPSSAEKYYSAEAALFMAHKWSQPDIVERLLREFHANGSSHLQKAAETFEARSKEGRLPAPLDPEHKVASFVGNMYAEHRFSF